MEGQRPDEHAREDNGAVHRSGDGATVGGEASLSGGPISSGGGGSGGGGGGRGGSSGAKRHSVLVRNVPDASEPQHLKELFSKFGIVKDVYLPMVSWVSSFACYQWQLLALT